MFKKAIDDIHPFLSKIVQNVDLNKDYYLSCNNYEWYFTFGKMFKPKHILELGVRYGYSAASMIYGSEFGLENVISYTGVDWEEIPMSNQIARDNLNKLFPYLEINIVTSDTNKLEHYMVDNKMFDLIHLDACHKEGLLKEFEITWPMLEKNGILIIDDMFSYYTKTGMGFNELNTINFLKLKLEELYFNGQIFSITKLNTYRGTYIIQKGDL